MRRAVAVLPAFVAILSLAGCDDARLVANERARDPALAAALNAPLMTDADLTSLNRANSAAVLPSQDGSLPVIDDGAEAIEAARAEALRLVGRMRSAPEAERVEGGFPAEASLTSAARAEATPRVVATCAEQVGYTAMWAARLPVALPVYPHGAVQEAAGTNAAGCSLRVVNFVTPVPLADVIDFYFTRAEGAGYSVRHTEQGGDDVLSGSRGAASFTVYARRLPSGLTEVDLVTSGG